MALPNGTLTGIPCPPSPGFPYAQYLGIPFANAPVGSLRFAPPQAYSGPFSSNATVMPNSCMQPPNGFAQPSTATYSEDCLYLNIYAPVDPAAVDKGMPVKVFFHGGSLTSGSNAVGFYNGCASGPTSRSIIVVPNYRLGAFGQLAHPSLQTTTGGVGNWGFQDQQLALRYVKENIASFGGDPTQVLAFGESAGGDSVWAHLVAPDSNGLFRSVLSESGTPLDLKPLGYAFEIGKTMAGMLNCTTGDVATCLRKASAADVLSASIAVDQPSSSHVGFNLAQVSIQNNRPWVKFTLDGVVFKQQPFAAIRDGNVNNASVVAGSNADEGRLFLDWFTHAGRATPELTTQNYTDYITASFPPSLISNITSLYPLNVTDLSPFNASTAVATALSSIITDRWYACPNRKGLNLLAEHNPSTYQYFFSESSTCPWLNHTVPTFLKASHMSEVPYVFDLIGPMNEGLGCNSSAGQLNLASNIGQAWTFLAATGAPVLAMGMAWPNVSAGYVEMNETVGLVTRDKDDVMDTYWASRCAIWDVMDDALVWNLNGTVMANGGWSIGKDGSSASAGGSEKSGTFDAGSSGGMTVLISAAVALFFQ
ncbi:hypothetical protein HKX48_005922 [Thoreauomyces humboldtii]|nr:hypothetical protein HKX48_005922 [Thoreauomyces humboldtii]